MVAYRPLILTGIIMLPILALFGYYLYVRAKRNKEDQQVEILINNTLDYRNVNKNTKSLDQRIIMYWSKLLKESGMVDPLSDDTKNATKIVIVTLVLFLGGFILTMNPIAGLIPAILFNVVLTFICKHKINKIDKMVNEQIPAFLSALKSNVQSNATAEIALMGAIDNTADPLYSELEIVKSLIETGSFVTALSALRQRTKNENLKFLCSCIQLSSEVGADLEEQISVIEHMIRERRALERKTDSAVAENMPILYVVAVAIPFLFAYMYFTNEQTRDFWFKSWMSWMLFFLIFVIIGAGTWFGFKIINKVKDM